MPAPAIELHELSKRFGALTAVSKLTFQVQPGEVMGFLGPNGAGKTTTIRMLLGFLRPTAGWCSVLGDSPTVPSLKARIGYLPGDFRIDPTMTGHELFAWFGRLHGGLDQAWLAALIDRLQADPGRRFGTLSKGNRQKIGLIQAFQHRPDVLILDEPTTGLDPLVQHEFLRLVREAAGNGAAVLFSSHVLPEVEHAAQRLAIIRQGELVTVANMRQLLDRARHHLELRFAAPIAPALFKDVPGVVSADVEGDTAIVAVDGPVGPAMAAALRGPDLLRVSSAGDDLEDLFLSVYDQKEAR